jgi:predicted nucleic acid-binding protein
MGLALMPDGRRQRTLMALFEQLLAEDLEHRVLDFDSAAATQAAELAARRQRAGRPLDMRHTQIAGIALARHAAVATRNVRHFGDLEVPVINPWAGL